MTRWSLRISKTPDAWRWYYEDMDALGVPVVEESGDYSTWKAAEAAARAAHPEITDRVWVHAVRGWGVAFEDSLPSFPLSQSPPT